MKDNSHPTDAAPEGDVVNTASLLRNLYDLERLALAPRGVCRLASSYDRRGSNADFGNFQAIDGNRTAVLAEMKGPGAIVRLHAANPQGTLKIYLDDQPEPVIACPFASFYKDPAYAPVRIQASGGRISYWPIPYAKSCKVVVEQPTNFFYWQFNYQTYPVGTRVETYSNELSAEARTEREKVLQVWRQPEAFVAPKTSRLGETRSVEKAVARAEVQPGQTAILFDAAGPGCMDSLLIRTRADIADLKRLVLRIYWDGEREPGVESPLPEFFGSGLASRDFASLPTVMKQGEYYLCRFPMPFAGAARVQLENYSAHPVAVETEVEHRRLSALAPEALYFHARWRKEITRHMVPFTILNTTGRGRFVGCSLTVQGGDRGGNYQEGDDMIFVDGERTSSLHGTGMEDYFNCGWYFAGGPVQLPLHGCTESSFDGAIHRTAAYRFQIPDDVTFTREISVQLEHGCDMLGRDVFYPDQPPSDKWCYPGVPYAGTAFFYQTEPRPAAPAITSAAALDDFVSPGPPAYGAVEAEDCSPSVAGGRLEMKKWEEFAKHVRGTIVPTLVPDGAGAALEFLAPIRYADCYEIVAFMVKGRDYGACTCSTGDQVVGEADLYTDGDPYPSGVIRLGTAVLRPGENRLRFTIRDKNPGGQWPKIGVDRLLLRSNARWIIPWQVIGPFPNPGASIAAAPDAAQEYGNGFRGIDEVYPPEQEGFQPGKTYRGSVGDVAWKAIEAEEKGYVSLVKHLHLPGESSESMRNAVPWEGWKSAGRILESNTGYLFTRITSPEEMDTELNVAPSDSLKVWLNGREIFRCNTLRDPNPWQHDCWMPIHLKRGENTLLLKVTHSMAEFWGCYARIRDADGKLSYSAQATP